MSDLSRYILQSLYEATGHNGQAVDVVSTLLGRWPQLGADDVRGAAEEAAKAGLITLHDGGLGAINGAGIRALSAAWKSGAFGPVPPAAAAHVERLHAMAASQSEHHPAPPTAQFTYGPAVDAQIQLIRRSIEGITQHISAATDLPMEEWSSALDLTAQLDDTLDALRVVLRRP